MKYSHIISKLFEPLLITPQHHFALCQLLENRLATDVRQEKKRCDDGSDGCDPEEVEPRFVGKTVIIPVHGTLVRYPEDIAMSECGCDLETLNAAIDAAENDPGVANIIFDFRTPGGSVTGIPETGRKIRNSRKTTCAFTASQCCSGGLWLASQCQQFYATQSSRVGSVGVYSVYLDLTEQMKMEGVAMNAISAGKFKLLGAYWKKMTEEERSILQRTVDKIYTQFKEAMETYRMVNDENFGNGLVFDGEEAAEIGFTDGVAEDISEVVDLLNN